MFDEQVLALIFLKINGKDVEEKSLGIRIFQNPLRR